MYGKLMSVSDDLMFRYFELVTRVSEEEIQALKALHPMEAKKRLAWTVTAMYHGEAGAREGEAHFSRVVQGGKAPDNVDEIRLPLGGSGVPGEILPPGKNPWPVWRVIKEAGLVVSSSEAHRMIQQGAVEVDGERVSDANQTLSPGQRYLIRVGKRRFKRVVLGDDMQV
jgi:tyrosyl-tRNA synthetase